MRKLRLRVGPVLVLFAAACSSPTADPVDNPAAPSVASISVTPTNATLSIGSARAFTAVASDASGSPVSATFTWQTTRPGVAAVDQSGNVSAVSAGAADITASSGNVRSAAVAVTVTDGSAWPTGGESSGSLITTALQQGALTSEQALVYRMFAAFGDPRLPPAYRGIADDTPDDPVVMEAASRFPTLSAAAQAELAPFFVPPPYAGSWYEARRPTSASPAPAVIAAPAGGEAPRPTSPMPAPGDCLFLPWHRSISTEHFKIHYDSLSADPFTVLTSVSVAVIAAEAERVWTEETQAFGREPLSDGAVTTECNGGDGKLDIYVKNMYLFERANGASTRAKVMPYVKGTCERTPSYISIAGSGDADVLRNALAHEFFHVLELGSYDRSANCFNEYYWLGEATANWAMDLVYGVPNDQYEQRWAGRYMDSERLVPLDEAYQSDQRRTNGYCDYVFLLYLARKYDDSVIRAIWDASESFSSLDALSEALSSKGGLETVWPEFALAAWNDYQAGVEDDLHVWDELEWGIKRSFDRKDAGDPFGTPSIAVAMAGASRKGFELLTSTPSDGGVHELPRLSIHADYLKFTDSNVSSVLYLNGLAFASLPQLKIQALIKQGGQWQPAEDWTLDPYRTFCRDLRDERIEELVLIYSNSDDQRPSPGVPFALLPRVNVSNVGCARWEGTSSVETVVAGPAGGTQSVTSSGLVFEREPRVPGLPQGGSGFDSFTATAGLISGSSTAPCITTSAIGSVAALDGTIQINFDVADFGSFGPPPDRNILLGSGTSELSTTTVHCTAGTSVAPGYWEWLQIPVPGTNAVSADGRSMEGTSVSTASGTTTTLRWNLSAVREP